MINKRMKSDFWHPPRCGRISVVGEYGLGLRLFLGQEAGHAFHLVMGLEAVAEQLFLHLNGLLDGQADALVDGGLDAVLRGVRGEYGLRAKNKERSG